MKGGTNKGRVPGCGWREYASAAPPCPYRWSARFTAEQPPPGALAMSVGSSVLNPHEAGTDVLGPSAHVVDHAGAALA